LTKAEEGDEQDDVKITINKKRKERNLTKGGRLKKQLKKVKKNS